jgi:AcrR family transcriptional regulator
MIGQEYINIFFSFNPTFSANKKFLQTNLQIMDNFPLDHNLILETAIDHFRRYGYKKTKMSAIAKDCKMKKKDLLALHRSKPELFKDVFLELYGRIAPQLQDIMDAEMPVFDKIRHFTNEYVRFVNDYKFLPLGLIRKLNSRTDFAKEFIVNLRMPDPTLFYEQIEREIEKGRIKPINPKQLMINIFALSVFPNVASPLMKDFINAGNDEFEAIKEEGRTQVANFVINSIRVPDEERSNSRLQIAG